MKKIPKDKLKQLVSEKGFSVTRGEKPKQTKPVEQKPQIVQIPDKETAKIVIASAEVVVKIAEKLDIVVDKLSQSIQSIEKIVEDFKNTKHEVQIIEKNQDSDEYEIEPIRDTNGMAVKYIKRKI